MGAQRRDPEPGVDHEVSIYAADVPDVAAHIGMRVPFGYQPDAAIEVSVVEPGLRDGQRGIATVDGACRRLAGYELDAITEISS